MAYEITGGKVIKAKKVVIYGPEGVGKSSFASCFPAPVFIDTEGSTNNMDVRRLPRPTSWAMLGEELAQILKTKPCGTLVIDTIDWAENLCIEHICAKAGKGGIEDFGYGNGYVYEKEEFAKFLNRLEEVIEAGINVVLTAHAQLRKFSQPDEIGEYDRWELKLGKKTGSVISPLVKEWADLLLFANYKTMAVAIDKDGKKFKAQGNARVMYTEHHPCWDAKNRFGLAPELPFEYSQISHLFVKATKDSTLAKPSEDGVTGYWYNPENHDIYESPALPSPECIAVTEKEFLAMKRGREEVAALNVEKKETATSTSDIDEATDGIPSELLALMNASGITESDIRHAVSLKGYYPEDTPIQCYDNAFISGVLIGAWEKIKAFITEHKNII